MRKQSLDFLKKLLSTPSPSGFEERIQAVCKAYAKPYVDKIYKDVHGNQYHVKNPNAKLRVMLAGHVDEIALMVHHIDDKGFLGFQAIGGVDPSVLDGQRVHVHTEHGTLSGVIGRRAIHLTDAEDRGKPMKFQDLWIDIGAKDKKEAQKHVDIGDPATIDAGFIELLNGRAVARAMDDRIGAFICIEAMRLLQGRKIQCAVYCVTTVQEEIGLRGATTSAYGCDPHVGIAVDVGHATDHPNCDNKRFGSFKLDEGPIITRGPNINPIVWRGLMDVAKKKKIPYQVEGAPRGTGTDANAMQLSRGGVATGLIHVPNRYMHSPVEMVSLKDAEHCAQLLAEWICTLTPNKSFIP
ncbi:MAG TPA: M42 family metallopeptidase [Candidatus Hydrogenedentes bacterium]|nr:M42 family metallopeptidase [Candidatus Hydrogenedentota bacterium]